MKATSDRELSPADLVNDIPRALAAMREAWREALLDHKRTGDPICVWENDQVVWIQPEDIVVDDIATPAQDVKSA